MKINEVYIAAAGSGKTTHIVNLAISNPHLKVLITTYTIANTDEIKKKFYEMAKTEHSHPLERFNPFTIEP